MNGPVYLHLSSNVLSNEPGVVFSTECISITKEPLLLLLSHDINFKRKYDLLYSKFDSTE